MSDHKVDDRDREATLGGSEHDGKDTVPSVPHFESDDVQYIDVAQELHANGVKRIEAIAKNLSPFEQGLVFLGCFLIAYVYGLDGTIRYTYQSYATASYSQHSLLATVNVLRSVIGAVGQPTAAKIADVFGRFELILVSIVFYIVGTIVEATSSGVEAFAAGAVLYQIGYTTIQLLVEVIIADLSSLRSRLFFSFVPALPFVINTWVVGKITQSVLTKTTWNWGIGMFGIIYPASTILLLVMLWIAQRRAKRNGDLKGYLTPFQRLGWAIFPQLFWQLDVIGIILMIASFALFLVPFTLAGGSAPAAQLWRQAHIIAPLVIGVCCFPLFFWWESKAKYPLLPYKLLRDRGVWAGFGVASMLNTAWYMQGDFLYPVVIVAFNQSIDAATTITSLYSFSSVITGTLLGLVVIRVRVLKPFIVFGCCLFAVAFGLLIRYRGDPNEVSGLIGAQVVLGIAGGFFSYPTQASVQARTKHEHVAVVTGLYLASYFIGSALGSTISGAIWTQLMPGELASRLGNQTLADAVFADPYTAAITYPLGTAVRTGIIDSYTHVQRILCIVGICFCIPLICFSLLLRNPELGKEQSLPDAETESAMTGDTKRSWLWR